MGTKGLEAFVVSVESDISRGLYQFDIVGLGDKAVTESKLRILSAIKNSGFASPKTLAQKITVLLSPAGIKKEGSHFDLPIAISYLQKCGEIRGKMLANTLIVGELSLRGKLQPIKNIFLLATKAKDLGYKNIIIPRGNMHLGKLIDGICIFPAGSLRDAIDILNGNNEIRPLIYKADTKLHLRSADSNLNFAFDMISGQSSAKRALEIALAGKHNIAFYGPPGTGKSLLAKAAAELVPALSKDEEVVCKIIHEQAGHTIQTNSRNFRPPFREPHHTSSCSSLIGNATKVGELSLAHNGILFLDELAEFKRDTLEALRQPIEDGYVKNFTHGNMTNSKLNQTLPADCIIIAAMNLCRCGNHGSALKNASVVRLNCFVTTEKFPALLQKG
jgi:magnesium chelatase family protein